MNNVMTDTIPRRYYMIGELARELGVPRTTLRFWQSEFGFEVHRRKPNSYRHYTVEEAEKVKEIHRLLNVEMYTIAGAKRQLRIMNGQEQEIATALNVMP